MYHICVEDSKIVINSNRQNKFYLLLKIGEGLNGLIAFPLMLWLGTFADLQFQEKLPVGDA